MGPRGQGVDEVGRGPLAGPVVAAAVVLPPSIEATWLREIRDSKVLTARARQRLAEAIRAGELDQARTRVPRRTQHGPSQARLLLVKHARARRRAALPPGVPVDPAAKEAFALAARHLS